MQIHIKNMVCPRCVMAVEQILNRLDVPFDDVNIGSINLVRALTEAESIQFDQELKMIGFEVLKDRKQVLVEEVKIALSEMLNAGESMLVKTSSFLSERFNLEYSYLSSIFSEIQGESIEKYLIKLKVEKVKELLSYDATLAEIAAQLQYSSIAHLSNQFKKTTGLSPSVYKKQLV
ncbi:helix-turn-helix domain-containing protein [Sphingobacterium mizutaii]|uniref:helix-turn-helix domain-containing protein n=1 Tax=Sphingobacterium mizutaii TaxID=1010 RepID=UPI0028AEFEB0|nr:helix-turn-helix domain-containing protein [Sphingobacterium mizutaii]